MRKFIIASLFLLAPTLSYAQIVVNPTKLQFTASTDHNVVENGTALVASYELRIFTPPGDQIVRTVNLNKPTPDPANLIIVTITSTITTLPPGDYVARVASKGPGGESVSEISNPFQVTVRPPVAPTAITIIK